MKKVGILYICTGSYDIFWKEFYESCEQFLLNDSSEDGSPLYEKHYFVFTDVHEIFDEQNNTRIHRTPQANLGWPNNTLMRFEMFLRIRPQLEEMHYLFFFNANLQVALPVSGKELLPQEQHGERLVATLHPGFFNKARNVFTYEHDSRSTAYISDDEGVYYVAGGLNGGLTKDFFEAISVMNERIATDHSRSIVARFHDESHWNRYIIERNDVKILGPEYIYPEEWSSTLNKQIKIVLRDKERYIPVFQMRLKSLPIWKRYIVLAKIKLGRLLKKHGLRAY